MGGLRYSQFLCGVWKTREGSSKVKLKGPQQSLALKGSKIREKDSKSFFWAHLDLLDRNQLPLEY